MATLKTARTDASVDTFLAGVADERRRDDARAVSELFTRVTGEQPAMWGDSIVGYGHRRLRYATGRELDWFVVGFSPRKQALTLYLDQEFPQRDELLARLGRHTTGKGCVYVKNLAAVDLAVLEDLVRTAVRHAD